MKKILKNKWLWVSLLVIVLITSIAVPTAAVTKYYDLVASSLTATNLTAGNVPYVGAGGLITNEAAFAYNSGTNTLDVDAISAPSGLTANTMTWSTLGAAHSWGGVVETGTIGETIAFGDLVYFKSNSKWWLTDADAAATTDGILAICVVGGIADATGTFLTYGYVRDDSYAWGTVGAALYVQVATGAPDPGDMTQTAPSGAGDQVRRVGFAKSATIILFTPDTVIIELT
jgi:hypothetical protein